MKKLALIFTFLASSSAWAQANLQQDIQVNIKAGKAKSLTCAACHGADGNSVITMYPSIAGQHSTYIKKQLKDMKLGLMSGGKQGRYDPIMSTMSMSLSDQDMKDLAAYYASIPVPMPKIPMIKATTTNKAPITNQGQSIIDKGKQLYRAGDLKRGITACIACHGIYGNGTDLSGFPKISGQQVDYTKAQLKQFRDDKRRNDMNGMMRDIAKKMTDEDIEMLSQYLAGLHQSHE